MGGALLGCGEAPRGPTTIPAREGPLQLAVVYPDTTPVHVTDSIAVWGTVGTGRARLEVSGQPVPVEPNGAFAAFIALPTGPDPVLEFAASLADSVIRRVVPIRRPERVPVEIPDIRPARRLVRLVRQPPVDTGDLATRRRPVFSRWTPGGTLAMALPLGARLRVEAETETAIRVRLAEGLAVWVSNLETEPVPGAGRDEVVPPIAVGRTRGPHGRIITATAASPIPWSVDFYRGMARWTLLGARIERPGRTDSLQLRQVGPDRVVIEVPLDEPPLGWRVRWEEGAMRLELREGPRPDRLEGLVVVLDPGHPPAGTRGPSGLREDSVALAVAVEAASRLRALGATPILTREDTTPVSLDRRVELAEAADAEVFVSIHLNSPGDGRPPTSVEETQAFLTHRGLWGLAYHLADSVSDRLGTPGARAFESNLVVVRPTWFPAVLLEATAMVLPHWEASFRTPEGIAAYAEGIVAGLTGWLTRGR